MGEGTSTAQYGSWLLRLFFNGLAQKRAGFVERRWAAGMLEGEFIAARQAVVETPKNL